MSIVITLLIGWDHHSTFRQLIGQT